jgi:sugar O-acyltransferase (sialic acid O-acetyltransferase NeuD family)
MIIVGAKGFAKELLEVCHQLGETDHLVFYDDLSNDVPEKLFGTFDILRSEAAVKSYFDTIDKRFVLGLGNPTLRHKMAEQFTQWGGELTSVISPKASIGHYNNRISLGACIMTGTVITNDVKIGDGVLLNLNCTVGHDVEIGAFTEITPGAHISGNVKIGKNCFIGTGAVILQGICVGDNSIIGAGSVVTKNVPPDTTIVGVPGKIIKHV